jgi:hypothetical protein
MMYRILSKGIISRHWKMSTEQNVYSLAANKTVSCSLEVTRIVKNFPFNILFFSCYKRYSSDRKGIRFPVLLQRVWCVTLEILTVQQKPHSIHWTAHTLPGSSVSIVSDYGLDDWAIGVRSMAGAKDFSSCVQTGSEAHPASCTMGTGGSFLRGKAQPGRDADHSPLSSAKVKNG